MTQPPTDHASAEARCRELGLSLEKLAVPAGNYVPARRFGDVVITSSISAKDGNTPRYLGKLGDTLDTDAGRESARDAAINCLAAIRSLIDSLDNISHAVRVVGYVNSTPDFDQHHKVVDAASDLLIDVFGERGQHTRAAIGVDGLPLNCSVGIELTIQLTT